MELIYLAKKPFFENLEDSLFKNIVLKNQASFCLFLSNYIELQNDEYWGFDIEIPEIVRNISNEFSTLLNIINKNEDIEQGERSQIIESLIANKSEISKVNLGIDYQYKQLNQNIKFLEKLDATAFYGKEPNPDFIFKNVLEDAMDFLHNENDNFKFQKIKSKFMECIPVKMTNDSFFEYIYNSIKYQKNLENTTDEEFNIYIADYLNFLKSNFKPDECQYYNMFFKDSADRIAAFTEKTYSEETEGFNKEQLIELIDSMEQFLSELSHIKDYLMLIFESINCLLIILMYPLEFELLLKENFKLKDIYFTVLENDKNSLNDIFGNSLLDSLYPMLDNIMEAVAESSNKCNKRIEKIDSSEKHSDNYEFLLQSHYIVSGLFYENIYDTEFDKETKGDFKQIFEEFKECLSQQFKKCSPKQRRFLKQNLMDLIMCPFEIKELYHYIFEGFKTASPGQKSLIIDSILNIISNDDSE